ncbi:MAG: hydrogenase maturation protease [Solirubrobacterales bacterium]
MAERPRARVVVIGVGNALRGDDAAGLHVARRLRADPRSAGIEVRELEGEALALLDIWEGADAAVIVDAVSSGAPPGTIHRMEAEAEPLPSTLRGSTSTHALGLREAIELARALHRLPAHVVIYGVEGRDFEAGTELSTEVEAVLGELAGVVLDGAWAVCRKASTRWAPAGESVP